MSQATYAEELCHAYLCAISHMSKSHAHVNEQYHSFERVMSAIEVCQTNRAR